MAEYQVLSVDDKSVQRNLICDVLKTANGWRDPELVKVFLELLKNNPDQLKLPKGNVQTRDELTFESIASTDVIDWQHK